MTVTCGCCHFSYLTKALLADHLRDLRDDYLHLEHIYLCECDSSTDYSFLDFLNHLNHSHSFSSEPETSVKTEAKKLFSCPQCSQQFTDRRNMKKHEKLHLGLKPFVCSVCGHSFARRSNLTQHNQVHQRNNVIFNCSICDKPFMSKSALRLHFRIHTNENPFGCDLLDCDQKFRTNKQKLQHFRQVHMKEESSNRRSFSPESANKVVQQIAELSGAGVTENAPLEQSATSAFKKVTPGVRVQDQQVWLNHINGSRTRLVRRASETAGSNAQIVKFNTSVEI